MKMYRECDAQRGRSGRLRVNRASPTRIETSRARGKLGHKAHNLNVADSRIILCRKSVISRRMIVSVYPRNTSWVWVPSSMGGRAWTKRIECCRCWATASSLAVIRPQVVAYLGYSHALACLMGPPIIRSQAGAPHLSATNVGSV